MKRSTAIVLAGAAVVAIVGVFYFAPLINLVFPSTPDAQPVVRAKWLDQNWSTADRYWFHHASQGTSTIPVPYSWFVALEAPKLTLFGDPPMLASPAYMTRLGFIPSMKGGKNWQSAGYATAADPGQFSAWGDGQVNAANPGDLPVGFAITHAYRDPATGQMLPDQVGLTCAACHTGHLEYKGTSLRIDGANSAASLDKLTSALGASLLLTDKLGWRFDRFARRVLGPDAGKADKDRLKAQLDATVAGILAGAKTTKPGTAEGFNRLDALNRIGNQVFFVDLAGARGFDSSVNNVANAAPVKYPHLWDTPWFIWAQYDASIMQPVIRNAGEALGVAARINLTSYDDRQKLWASSVDFKHLGQFEAMLSGPDPLKARPGGGVTGFAGLRAPKWPEAVLGKLDPALVAKGAALYAAHCQACHLAPVNAAVQAFYGSANWTTPTQFGESFLKVKLVDQSYVGTDPGEAEILVKRQVKVPAGLGIEEGIKRGDSICFDQPSAQVTTTSFGQALANLVQQAVAKYITTHNITQKADTGLIHARQDSRPNCIQAKVAYKARPLDGIWATPPYLHNGSVPSLDALLGSDPAKDRPGTFCLGNRAYDPRKVGLETGLSWFGLACPAGTFRFDASQTGNSNRGHEFRDGPRGNGVIGPALSDDDRKAIIEFLKSQ